nr:uncharacterized protein LOC127318693 [Lolium perenne]
MLDVPFLQKLNLKFSAWIMSRVDVHNRSIVITDKKILKFWPQDVSKVFGIPHGPRNVIGRDATIRPDAIEFIKTTLGMNQAGAHSLKAAENFLIREITEDSSKIEKDCFQIAFVIFVMGHILAPSSKYDYATIDFWGALANTENIAQFNWGEYIIQSLLDAVDKYKRDVRNQAQTINLFGCHLWLQVFLLDNLDLGIFNKRHDDLPRIKVFDQDWLRRTITMASDLGKGPNSYTSAPLRSAESVCYTRASVRTTEVAPDRIETAFGTSTLDNVPLAVPEPQPHESLRAVTPRPLYVAADSTPIHSTQSLNIGPIDFSNYLKRQYPKLMADPLTLMLKEHNAKAFSHLHTARSNILNDMFKFTDKLMAHLSQRCVCCQARGFTDCPLVPTEGESAPPADSLRTPVNQKLSGVRLDLSDAEDSTTRGSAGSSKRPPIPPECVVSTKKSKAGFLQRDTIKDQCLLIYTKTESLYNAADQDPQQAAVFGQLSHELPKRRSVLSGSFAKNPWRAGRIPPQQPGDVATDLEASIKTTPPAELERFWFVHDTPRLVCVSGNDVLQQLAGEHTLEHELSCALLRRYNQIDFEYNDDCPYLNWRHILETDFATTVLSGKDYLRAICVQNQFFGKHIRHSIACSQYYFAPAILEDGWVLYMWDMVAKVTHVLDPLAGARGPSSERKEMHEWVSSRLHDALFECFAEFFAGWPTAKDNWGKIYPKIVDTTFTRYESGLAILHLLRYYDGEKLISPITKRNLHKTRLASLHELMKLRENRSPLAGDALWAVLAPSQFSFGDFLDEVDT